MEQSRVLRLGHYSLSPEYENGTFLTATELSNHFQLTAEFLAVTFATKLSGYRHFQIFNFIRFGGVDRDGKVPNENSIMTALDRSEIDMSLNPWSLTYDRYRAMRLSNPVDHLYPFLIMAHNVTSAVAKSTLSFVFRPFCPDVWVAVVCSLCLLGAISLTMERHSSVRFKTIVGLLFATVTGFFCQSYTSNMRANISITKHSPPFSDVEGMRKSVESGRFQVLMEYSGDDTSRNVILHKAGFNNLGYEPNLQQLCRRIVSEPQPHIVHYNYLRNLLGCPEEFFRKAFFLYIPQFPFISKSLAFGRTRADLVRIANRNSDVLTELYSMKLGRAWRQLGASYAEHSTKLINEKTSIALEHLVPAFAFWLLGLLLGATSLAVEIGKIKAEETALQHM